MTSPSAAPELGTRRLSWMLLCIGLFLTITWLDSLERYLGARYHVSLEAWLPPELMQPSRLLGVWLGHDAPPAPVAMPPAATVGSGPAGLPPTVQTPGAAGRRSTAPASGVSVASGSSADSGASVASGASAASAAGVASAARRSTAHPANPEGQPEAVVAASAPSGKTVFLVKPLPAGEFLPTQRNQSFGSEPQRILFAGDSMMQGVAPLAIRELTKLHPGWQMFDESRQSTGLTVKRYFDWPARIIESIEQKKLTMVIVFLGPNDPWDIYEPGRNILFPSPQWEERYASRVDEILSYATEHKVQVIWIGLPSMREGRVRDGAIVQNRIFSQRAQAFGTDYLATEGLIGPLSLPFKRYMGEESAKATNLRAEDGIHFTPSGLQRIKQALLEHLQAGSAQP